MTLNMVTALVTEGESPAIMAKHHKKVTIINGLKTLPYLMCRSGLNIKLSIHRIIPTCNPETARIWMVPEFT